MTLEIQQFHDCRQPKMYDEVVVQPEWTLADLVRFRKPKPKTKKIYKDVYARWTCPVCDSKWSWSKHLRYWRAEERTSVWEEVNG